MAQHSTPGSTGMPSVIFEQDVEDIQLVVEVTSFPCALPSAENDISLQQSTVKQGDIQLETTLISQEQINEECRKPTRVVKPEFQYKTIMKASSGTNIITNLESKTTHSANDYGTHEEAGHHSCAVRPVRCRKRNSVNSYETHKIREYESYADPAQQGPCQQKRRTVVLPGPPVPPTAKTVETSWPALPQEKFIATCLSKGKQEDIEIDSASINASVKTENDPAIKIERSGPEKSQELILQNSEASSKGGTSHRYLHEARCSSFVDLRDKLNLRRRIYKKSICLRRSAKADRKEPSGFQFSNIVTSNFDPREASRTQYSTSLSPREQTSIQASTDLGRGEPSNIHGPTKLGTGQKEDDNIRASNVFNFSQEHSNVQGSTVLNFGQEPGSIHGQMDLKEESNNRPSTASTIRGNHASTKLKMGHKEDNIQVSVVSNQKEHSNDNASTNFDCKEPGSIQAPTNFSQHQIRYHEAPSSSSSAGGRRAHIPFVSEDPEENWDNYNPGWNSFRCLSTDQARYEAVLRLWRNRTIPNPHANFTRYFHLSRQDPTHTSRKRKASTQVPSDESSTRPAKRMRLDTYIYDKKLEELEMRRSQECCMARELLQARIERLRSEFQNRTTEEGRGSRRHCRSSTVPWNMQFCQQQQREEQLQQLFQNRKARIANHYAARMDRLRSARQEVQHFNMFYIGLVDVNPRVLSAVQMEEQLMIEKLLGHIKSAYRASCPVQFAEDVPHIDSRSFVTS